MGILCIHMSANEDPRVLRSFHVVKIEVNVEVEVKEKSELVFFQELESTKVCTLKVWVDQG